MIKHSLLCRVLGLSLFLFQASAWAAPMYGVFMVTKGSVKVQNPKTGTSDAKVGVKVYEGDTIITAADSRAKIVMSDRNVINVNPETQIQIAKYENDPASGKKNVELNLLEGKVRNNVEQTYDGDKSKFLIKTPTAVAGVRGTQFLAGYSRATQMTSIVTFKGAVTLASVSSRGQVIGSPVLVKKGETTTAAPNAAPETPRVMPKEEVKKMDVETASTSQGPAEAGSQSREVASETSVAPTKEVAAPQMVDKKDMDLNTISKEITVPTSPRQEIPSVGLQPPTTRAPATPAPLPYLPKTQVIVRPQPKGN